jgi:hypothetical protein
MSSPVKPGKMVRAAGVEPTTFGSGENDGKSNLNTYLLYNQGFTRLKS